MTSHHVAMATLWRSRRRADLVPGTPALAQEVVWLLADLWDEREDGLAERADALGDRLRDALRARGADAQHDLNGLLGLVLIALGLLARDSGAQPRDEALFAEGLETSPSHASPLHALALLHTGRTEDAGRVLAELGASADPHAAYAQALLTRQQDPHLTLKQLEAACARWEHDLKLARLRHDLAERLGKLTPQVWSGLGRALSAAGRYAEAIPALRRSELYDAPTFELLATAYESLGDLEHAAPLAAEAAGLLSSAELHLRAADAYVATGRHAQAARQVDKALEAADEHVVRFAAAQILLATGDMPRALELIRQVRADLPAEPQALAVEGIALFGVRDYDAAQRLLTRAHELLPGEPIVLRHLAVTQFNLNRLDLAGPLLNQALDLDPDDGWMLAVRGDLRRRLVDLPGAREDLERAHRAGFEEAWTLRLLAQVIEADDPDRALRLLDRSLTLDPGNAATHALRGKVLYDKGEPVEADAALREALGIDAHDPVALTKLTEAGLLHWGDEQIALVKAAIETAIARVPGDIPLRWAYRAILLEQGLAAAAREVEMQITGIEPRDGEDHRLVGIAYSELGDREAAVATFRQGLALVPNYADLHAHLGVELNLLGRHQAAEEELTKAVELDGDHAFALARLGNLLLAAGRYEDAEPYLEKAKDLWPDSDPLLDLAEVLRMTGRPEEGLELAKQAVELQESPFAVGSRGQLYYAVGDLTRAAADLKRAVEMDPDLDWARGTLAEVYRMTGELDAAIREATKAIRPKADNRWLLSGGGGAPPPPGPPRHAAPAVGGARRHNQPPPPRDQRARVTRRHT
ncbi:tetratricopeptide repeat protein, partial [Nonomuraea typhae]